MHSTSFALGCAAVLLGACSVSEAASFQGLGWLTPSVKDSAAFGISGDGSVIVGRVQNPSGVYEAFRWTEAEGMVGLGLIPNATATFANAVSDDGLMIVGGSDFATANQHEAWYWNLTDGMVGLGDFPGGIHKSEATGVSADGQYICGSGNTIVGDRAFRITIASGMDNDIDELPGGSNYSIGRAISGDGNTVTGFSSSANGVEAFRWTESGGMVGIGDLPGGQFTSRAWGINTDGTVIVGTSIASSNSRPFRWTQSTGMVQLATNHATAFDVSADGSVVVGAATSSFGVFIWTQESGTRLLADVLTEHGIDLTGWTLMTAQAVSDNGEIIVGRAMSPVGPQAYRAVVPRPGVCCVGSSCADDIAESTCNGLGGLFLGATYECATVVCADVGACCFACASAPTAPCPHGSGPITTCVTLTEAQCDAASGLFMGTGSSCAVSCGCTADLDGDNATNASDFTILAGSYGLGAPGCLGRANGDLNCDGVVDAADFVILAGNFGCAP